MQTQKLLENEIMLDPDFENLSPFKQVDIDFEPLDELFKSFFGKEIDKILELQVKFKSNGQYVISKDLVTEFINKLFSYNCPRILKLTANDQQVFLLYLISVLFYRYNKYELDLDEDQFADRIYFVNILTICSKYLPHSRRLLYRVVKNIYNYMKEDNSDLLDIYAQLYRADETIIKNDVIYLFLRYLLPQFNPIEVENLEEFYEGIFRRVFYFYLKSKISSISNCPVTPAMMETRFTGSSERYRIYEEALYLAQIQTMCSDSGTINRISRHFDEMRSMIIPNEIQRLYLFASQNIRYSEKNEKIVLLKMNDEIQKMEKVKNKLPLIYRLLRSIHIISDTSNFLDSDVVLIKNTIYSILHKKFHNILSDEILDPVIQNVTSNLVRSLTTGEFLDMVTLTPVNLSGTKFSDQLQLFLELILSSLGTENHLLGE